MSMVIGEPVSRVDGPAKVTGAAKYAAEFDLGGVTHAALVLSTIPKGRIASIRIAEAERAPGVSAVITHRNAPRLPYNKMEQPPPVDPKSGDQLRVFQDATVHFSGQPIAVVVAETREQAEAAAALVKVRYTADHGDTNFDAARGRPPSEATAKGGRPGETRRGDADRALAAAAVKVDATYVQAREHHNAMEPHATIAVWSGDHLTLYDKTQWVDNDRDEIAHVFGIPATNIRVISPYVGGAFGSALRTWPHVTIAALAARQVRRPVRIELTRRELYSSIGFRPHTEQRVALGADRDGKLTAIIDEAAAQTSSYEEYAERTLDPARMAYSCANVRTRYRLVEMTTNSPCPMRAPGMVTGVLALEMAMDELAAALRMDPVELRLRNYSDRDEHKNLPWSSKELRACYETAAARFGWQAGARQPRSRRDGRLLVGHGMATALYPGERSPATASATLYANGTAVVRSAASDMGPGTYTSMTQVAAETLGLPLAQVQFELGDTSLPKAPVHGGSITMASVGCAVQAACQAVKDKVRQLGGGAEDGLDYAALLRRTNLDHIDATAEAKPGEEEEKLSTYAFGAVFADVRVDPDLGRVEVRRLVGAYDIGRVVNPKIARSQCIGGMVGGIGMALLEQAEWDERFGRVMNGNLAEYLVPVAADVGELDVTFVPSDDRQFNPLGVKGVAELGLCGVAPAIVNAIYDATGVRLRQVPVTTDRMLEALVAAG